MLNYFNHGLIDKAVTLYKSHGVEVFSFPVFSVEFCTKFIAEINHFNQTSMPKGRPNSMNNYGVSFTLVWSKLINFGLKNIKESTYYFHTGPPRRTGLQRTFVDTFKDELPGTFRSVPLSS